MLSLSRRLLFRPKLLALLVSATALSCSGAPFSHVTADASNTVSYCGPRIFGNVLDRVALNRVLASLQESVNKGSGYSDDIVQEAVEQYGGAIVTWHDVTLDLPSTAYSIGAPTSTVQLRSVAVIDHVFGQAQLAFVKYAGGIKAVRWQQCHTRVREFICGS